MNRTAHIIRGLPGAGKTTLARLIAHTTGAAHIELDTHRRRLWPHCPPSWDPYRGPGLAVQEAFEAEVAGLLAAGRDVVIDRTNLDPRGLYRIEHLTPCTRLIIHDLRNVRLSDCVARDAERLPAFRVEADGIRALAHRWL